MNTGKYIFAQLIEFLPQRIFDRIVMKYEGNKYVKHFTCWNQLLVMMFGQLSNRDSLRDLTNIAEVKHWHGAAKDSWFQHLTYHRDAQEGASNEWLELWKNRSVRG